MNIWELKRNKKLTKTYLRTVQAYINYNVQIRWSSPKRPRRLVETEDAVRFILKFLDLGDEVFFNPLEGNYLILKQDSAPVYITQTETTRYSLDYIRAAGLIPHSDGNYYAGSCYRSFKRYSEATGVLVSIRDLYWNVKPLAVCARCGATVEEHELVHNDMVEGKVDKFCHRKLLNWSNPLPDLGDPISPYHGHRTSWMFLPQRKRNEKSIPMGVEIEVHSSLGNDRIGATRSAQQITVAHPDNNFYFEWDGSLADGGFEMVTNPMTLEFHQDWWESVLKTMRKYCVGYNVEQQFMKNRHQRDLTEEEIEDCNIESYDYGIHITIARKNITDAAVAKLCRFFEDSKNKEFLWAIAQRSRMYGGFVLGSSDVPSMKNALAISKDGKKIVGGIDRRQPVNVKGKNFIEFRMFRSTLNQVSFLKNLEFIDAIIKYMSSMPGNKVDHRTFINWLIKPENSKRYPNLLIYLQHPLYFVRGAGKVKNTWSDLFMDYKLVIKDPLKEYGPKPLFTDLSDVAERSMI